jgi:hypothetical protein
MTRDPDEVNKRDAYFGPEDKAIEHLECGHCGTMIDDVQKVDLIEKIRWLCKGCRRQVIEWV